MSAFFSSPFPAEALERYRASGGYETAKKVLTTLTPGRLIEEVKRSTLDGFAPHLSKGKAVYLVVNATEGEAGSFKDRYILQYAPHLLIEGMLIAAHAIQSTKAYIYVRGEYEQPYEKLRQAVEEAYTNHMLGTQLFGTWNELQIFMYRGAGAHICSEDTALIESLEGKKGWPRLTPPCPAEKGLFDCPTMISSVETIAYLPLIMKQGAESFARVGAPYLGGMRLFSVSGHVARPGLYELPVNTSLRELIFRHAGGMHNGGRLKAVTPGSMFSKVLSAGDIDIPAGTMNRPGGVVVMNETVCMVRALHVMTRFFSQESCGQCVPCREGTAWIHKIVSRVSDGHGGSRDMEDVRSIASTMDQGMCGFGKSAACSILSYLEKFGDEFETHISQGPCASCRR